MAEIIGFAVRAPGREPATLRALRDSLARERRGRRNGTVHVVAAHPARAGVDQACRALGLEPSDHTHAGLAGLSGDTLGAAGAIHAALAIGEGAPPPGAGTAGPRVVSCNVLGRSGLAASLAASVGVRDRGRHSLGSLGSLGSFGSSADVAQT
jgi:hypothetical protein